MDNKIKSRKKVPNMDLDLKIFASDLYMKIKY